MRVYRGKLYHVLMSSFLFISVVSSFVSMGTYFFYTYASMKKFAYNNLAGFRDQQVMLINNWFKERSRDIKELSSHHIFLEQNLEDIETFLQNKKNAPENEFNNFVFVDADGKVLVDTGGIKKEVNLSDREYFKTAMAGKDAVSELLMSRNTGRPVIIISSPVYSRNGQIIGLVFGTVGMDAVNKVMEEFRIGRSVEAYLVDEKGVMLTESRFSSVLKEQGLIKDSTRYSFVVDTLAAERVRRGESGFAEYQDYRGKKTLGAFVWMPERKWGLIVEMDKNEVLGTCIEKLLGMVIIFLLLYTFVIYPLVRHLADRISEPLVALSRDVAAFAKDYNASPLSWGILQKSYYEELDNLKESFYKMAEKTASLIATLEKQALFDPLTGLANRRYFNSRAREMIELSMRNKMPCAVIFIDADRFKRVNDSYGHTMGDEVLKQLAEILKKNVRVNDLIGRMGGEEFVIISPNTNCEGAFTFAERLRKIIENSPVKTETRTITVTVSAGIAVFAEFDTEKNSQEILEELIKIADAAMYLAKEKGGNRVEIFGPDLPSQ